MLTNHEMTSVCFGIPKMQCQKPNIIGYFFSISYMPIHDMLIKRKKYAKKNKKKIQKQRVFVYIGTCVPWMAIETKFFKLYIFCTLDEYLYV